MIISQQEFLTALCSGQQGIPVFILSKLFMQDIQVCTVSVCYVFLIFAMHYRHVYIKKSLKIPWVSLTVILRRSNSWSQIIKIYSCQKTTHHLSLFPILHVFSTYLANLICLASRPCIEFNSKPYLNCSESWRLW